MTPELYRVVRAAKREYPHLDREQQREATARMRAGSVAARNALVGSYIGMTAQRTSRRAQYFGVDSDDAFQSAMLAAIEQAGNHDPDRALFGTHIKFAVMNGTRDQVNDRDRHRSDVRVDGVEPAGRADEHRDDRIELVMRRMELLGTREQTIVQRFANGDTLKDIGSDLGVSKQRVEQILTQSLTTLRGGTELRPPHGRYRK